MHRIAAASLAALVLAGLAAGPAAASPFRFDKGVGTCAALTARYDPASLWFGWVSAQSRPVMGDLDGGVMPFYAEGCFRTEFECRRFINEGLSFADGRLIGMRCEPGVPARALR